MSVEMTMRLRFQVYMDTEITLIRVSVDITSKESRDHWEELASNGVENH